MLLALIYVSIAIDVVTPDPSSAIPTIVVVPGPTAVTFKLDVPLP